MNNLSKTILDAKENLDPAIISSYCPFTREMGIKFLLEKNKFYTKLEFSGGLIGNPLIPALHGGVIASLLQNAAQFYVLWEKNIIYIPEIIDISINFLKKGEGIDTFARASIKNNGRRVVNTEVFAWNEDEKSPIASAQANFLI